MSFVIPTAATLSQQMRAAIKAAIPASDPLIWPNNLYFVTKTFALLMHHFYGRLEYVRRQARTVTADDSSLDDHGLDAGGLTRNTATYALGDAAVPTTIGAVIPTQTKLLRADNVEFQTAGDYTAIAASTTVRVRAADQGKLGNTEGGTVLTLETPIAGVGAFTVASDGLRGGADTESAQSFRQRILDRKRNPPHGGSPAEYKGWAREVTGVSRVFPKRASPGPGSVTVVFMMDDVYSDGIPSATDEAIVLEHLEEVAPANADIFAVGPVAVPINVSVAVVPDTARVRAQAQIELEAMFRRKSEPAPPGGTFVFSRSWIDEAISAAPEELRHSLTAPATDTTLVEDSSGGLQIAVLGTVSFL